jgi:hypothetical protein
MGDTHDTITLREYMESRFSSIQRAVDKAEESTEKRFAAVNEMRAMVTDAASKFMPRLEYETSHQALVEKVEGLQKFLWMGLGAMLAIQLFLGIVFVFIRRSPSP